MSRCVVIVTAALLLAHVALDRFNARPTPWTARADARIDVLADAQLRGSFADL